MTTRKILRMIHLWVGLTAGLFLIAASLSGSILVFRAEIDAMLHPDLFRVEPGEGRTSLDEVMRAVHERHPEVGPPYYVRVPRAPHETFEVWTNDEDGPHVFVDPYRGTVLGSLMPTESFTGFLFYWHARLLSGTTGGLIVGYGAILLLVLCITGAVLWWPGRKRWQGFRVKWGAGWKRVNYDLHRAGGIWALPFLLLTAVTGASFIFHEEFEAALNRLAASAPAPAVPSSTIRPGATPISLDDAVTRANAALPRGVVTWVYPPGAPDAVVTVRKRIAGEMHPNGKSFVYVDQYSGEVLLVDAADRASLGARIYNALYPLHIGRFGGGWMRVLYAILGLTPVLLAITGATIWWNRGRVKRPSPAAQGGTSGSPAPPRPALTPVDVVATPNHRG